MFKQLDIDLIVSIICDYLSQHEVKYFVKTLESQNDYEYLYENYKLHDEVDKKKIRYLISVNDDHNIKKYRNIVSVSFNFHEYMEYYKYNIKDVLPPNVHTLSIGYHDNLQSYMYPSNLYKLILVVPNTNVNIKLPLILHTLHIIGTNYGIDDNVIFPESLHTLILSGCLYTEDLFVYPSSLHTLRIDKCHRIKPFPKSIRILELADYTYEIDEGILPELLEELYISRDYRNKNWLRHICKAKITYI